jgi:hypothetical protein
MNPQITRLLLFLLSCILLPLKGYGQTVVYSEVRPSSGEYCGGGITVIIETDDTYAPYNYQWSNDVSGQTSLSNLCAGSYALSITDILGCQTVLDFVVEDCFNLEYDLIPAVCNGSGGGFLTVTPVSDTPRAYLFQWSDGTVHTGSDGYREEIKGRHCVTVTDVADANCRYVHCFDFSSAGCHEIDYDSPPLIVNEISNGNAPNHEYIELLVVGYGDCQPVVDIRNFIVDDNNGDFTDRAQGSVWEKTGIAHGHVRFANIPRWASVPVGSLILLYDPARKNGAIQLPNDPSDANGDKVYVVPINDDGIEGTYMYPTPQNPLEYRPTTTIYEWNMTWKAIELLDDRDAIQVRYPNGQYCHGISYGENINSARTHGGPGNIKVHDHGLSYGVALLLDGNYVSKHGYKTFSVNWNVEAESPGRPNTSANTTFIECLCNPNCRTGNNTAARNGDIPVEGHRATESTGAPFALNAYPNPFSDGLNVGFQLAEAAGLRLTLTDVLGATVHQQRVEGQTGDNLLALPLGPQLAPGVYFLRLTDGQGRTEAKRVVLVRE